MTTMLRRFPVLQAFITCVSIFAAGCDRSEDTEVGDPPGSDTDSSEPENICEVASVTELDSGDAVAPNGRTGSEIVAAIPETHQTTLDWDLSNSLVQVEVHDAPGQSSTLTLEFSVPSVPKFFYEERVVAPGAGEGTEVICDDYVKTSVQVSAQTEDGALSFVLSGVEVKLGTDDPSRDHWAKPFIIVTRPMTSPEVDFVSPVAQSADLDKNVALSFNGPEITGAITVYATESSETHRIVVARW